MRQDSEMCLTQIGLSPSQLRVNYSFSIICSQFTFCLVGQLMKLAFEHWLGGVRFSLTAYFLILVAFTTRANSIGVEITFPISPFMFIFAVMTPQTPHTPCIVVWTLALLQTAEVVQPCTLDECVRQTATGFAVALTCTLGWFNSRECIFPFTNLCSWKELLLG